jgi:hypothetical protein
MNRFPLVLAAVAIVVSGCTQPPSTTSGTSRPTVTHHDAPALPAIDMDTFLGDYKSFVTTYADRASNVPSHEAARQALMKAFADDGLQVWRHNFTDGIPQSNIVGIQWGAHRDQWVIVGGHYDTFSDDCIVLPEPCPGRRVTGGTYDDGSGTAITMYMAKLFAHLNATYTVAYVAFDGEERGLQGSHALAGDIADHATPFGNFSLRAVIDMDMVGLNWPGVSTPVEFSHNDPSLQAVVEAARKELGVPDDMIVYGDASRGGGSDFASFTSDAPTGFFSSDMGQEGAPAGPGTPNTPSAPGVYPFWHLVDTWETMTAMAGGDANVRSGFAVTNSLVAHLLHAVAFEPDFKMAAS